MNIFFQPIKLVYLPYKFEQIEPAELLVKVKQWYNGYYFHQNAIGIFHHRRRTI